jgi:hypothetical protein
LFRFMDLGDLKPFPGPRGRFVFFSPTDYLVAMSRQQYAGAT